MQDLSKRRYEFHPGALAVFVGTALVAGAVGGFLGGNMGFDGLKKAPLTPPGWVFPVVWTILYILMGIAAYLVWNTKDAPTRSLLRPYWLQLFVNMLWPLFFFRLEWRLFSFFWLLLLIGLVSWTMARFRTASRAAYWLLFPYLLWLLFAAYLNLSFYLVNL